MRNLRTDRRGVAIVIFSLLIFTVLIPMVGLAIDGGILYLVKQKLATACDAAALAGGRNLNNGDTPDAQKANAEAAMAAYFNANFPAGTWNTSNVQLGLDVEPNGPTKRVTSVNATVSAPLYFMRVIGKNFGTVAAAAKATREDVNLILVLDRSSSMIANGVCGEMVADARAFASQFTNGRDNVGLITFMSGANVDYPPSLNFKTQNPSLDATLSQLQCGGNTGSAQGLWLAYQQLQAINEPGALNLIVFFTDGQPNGMAFDFSGNNPNSILPIKTQVDNRYGTGTPSFPDVTQIYAMGGSSCQPLSAPMGVMAQWAGLMDPGPTAGMMTATLGAISNTDENPVQGTLNCTFTGDMRDMRRDIAYIPAQDHWGNLTSGYKAFNPGSETYPSGPYAGQPRVDVPTAIWKASTNAADNAANRIRNDSTLNPKIFTIGLGGTVTIPIDQEFLERVANDPRSTSFNANQQTGLFVYAADISQLGVAFQTVASAILRLSQ